MIIVLQREGTVMIEAEQMQSTRALKKGTAMIEAEQMQSTRGTEKQLVLLKMVPEMI